MPAILATDFEVELERTENVISELRSSTANARDDTGKRTRLAYRLYHRACLLGTLNEFDAAELAAEGLEKDFGHKEDLALLKANLYFKFHRLSDVKRELEQVPALRARPEGKALLADIDFQEGRYREAETGYQAAIAENHAWDNLARLAYFRFKMGEIAAADDLYVQAEDELTAKEMRSYAWVELQRGLLHLSRGRHSDALGHYRRAEAAYSGYWLIDEYMAELLGAQGKYEEAVLLYKHVVTRVGKPELLHALCELYALLGKLDEAERWQALALQSYLGSVEAGGVHYWHHLVDFYSDVRQDGAQAVKWARKDLALRDNFSTQGALAWALYRNGELAEAAAAIDRSLSSGVVDARLFQSAGKIYLATGQTGKGKSLLQEAATINPHLNAFHVHR